jgi:hypothetical protein
MDSVHGLWTMGGKGPRWTTDRASTVAHQSSASRPLWATAPCRKGGNAKRAMSATGGSLTGAWTAARWWRNEGRASAPSDDGVGMREEGRR